MIKIEAVSGNPIAHTLRDAWDHGDLDNTSISHKAKVRGASVGLLGMITGEELTDRLDLKELATGSLNRLLLVHVERSKIIDGHPPVIKAGHVAEPLARLKGNLERVRDARSDFVRLCGLGTPIELSDASLALVNQIRIAKETTGQTWIEAGNQRAYVQILRVACVYALADGADQIEPVHLQAAEAFVDYAATGIVALGSGELKDVIAQRILSHLRDEPTGTVSRGDINTVVFSKNVGGKDIEAALRQLMKLGLIEEVKVQTGKQGRPPTFVRLRTA